jgi:hypothetical protein
MKRVFNFVCILALVIVLPGLVGCKKNAEPVQKTEVASPQSKKAGLASAEKNSFQEVTAQLDPGGSVYVYLSTEQWLAGVAEKTSALRGVLQSIPDIKPADRQNLEKGFDLVSHLLKASGIEDVSGVGMSSIAREKDLYHGKVFIHHYKGKGSGFLWTMFGQKPHPLDELNLLPGTTALATFSDLDLAMVWSILKKEVGQADFPQAKELLDKVPAGFEQATGLNWEKVLASLGGEYGLVLTLDEAHKINIPIPSPEPVEFPEPGIMLVAKVKDDLIFNRIDEALEQVVQHMGQQVISVDQPNLKMRTVAVPLPLPIQLRPTVATSQGYLFVATTDALIKEVLDIKAGKKPGLKTTSEFQKLAKEVPGEGNSFAFVSERMGKALVQIQQQALKMSAARGGATQTEWIQTLFGSNQVTYSYSVSANTDEGWLIGANASQDPAKLVIAPAVLVPIGLLSAVAIPNFTKARESSQRNTCINNLRQIAGAKQQWALENNKTEADTPMRADLLSYLKNSEFPICPSGGKYTMNAIGTPPECSVPGHQLPAQ